MNDSLDNLRSLSLPLPVTSDDFTLSNPQLAVRQVTYDALVLDARLRQSLATVRSLGSRGLRVAALETSAGLPTFASRWCQQAFVFPVHEGTDALLPYLEELLEHTGTRVLISSSDGTIDFIRRHRERLERRVRIALAKEPALGIAINKEQTLAIAKRLGLGVPRGVTVGSASEVEGALQEIGLPAVVKPVESWISHGQQGARVVSQLVTSAEEARRAIGDLTCGGGRVLFQQFLSGRRESIGLLYADGQVYARFAQWAKRTNPPLGGVSSLYQSIAFPSDSGEQAERLVREIGLEGYSQVEFRRDKDGRPYLMEINPRLNTTIENAVYAGIDFPYLLYQWASGEQISTVKSYRVGNLMRDLSGDMGATFETLRQRGRPGMPSPARAIFDFFISFFMPIKYAYLDWKDPLPAWTATAGFVRYLLRRVGRSFLKMSQ